MGNAPEKQDGAHKLFGDQAYALSAKKLPAKLHIRPILLSLLCFLLSLAVAAALWIGQLTTGGWLLAVIALTYILKDTLVRLMYRGNRFEQFLCSNLDYLSSAAPLFGLGVYYSMQGVTADTFLVAFVLSGTMLVSYTQTRAETEGFFSRIASLARWLQAIILSTALILGLQSIALWVLAVGSGLIIVYQILRVYRAGHEDGHQFYQKLQHLIRPLAHIYPGGVASILAIAQKPCYADLTTDMLELLEYFPSESIVHCALLLAAERHCGQMYQRLSGPAPYLAHLVDVARCVVFDLGIDDPVAVTCALWHDMIEDNRILEQELRKHIEQTSAFQMGEDSRSASTYILTILGVLIRPDGYDAHAYYDRLAEAPPAALLVKSADLICNTSSLLAFHHARYANGQARVPFKDHWIPKYVTEVVVYVLNQPSFTALEVYPHIHNALLGILRDLCEYLQAQYPDYVTTIEQLSLERYGTSYLEAVAKLQRASPYPVPSDPGSV